MAMWREIKPGFYLREPILGRRIHQMPRESNTRKIVADALHRLANPGKRITQKGWERELFADR